MPPDAATREIPVLMSGAKAITPLFPHESPRGFGASQMLCTGPPDASMILSLPSEKKPIERLSGDQNGNRPPSVAATGAAVPAASDRSQSLPPAPKTTREPSGEIAIGSRVVAGEPELGLLRGIDERMNGFRASAGPQAAHLVAEKERGNKEKSGQCPRDPGLPSSLGNGDGRNSRLRSALRDPLQLASEIRRVLPAVLRVLRQGLLHDVIERGRRHRLNLRDRRRLVAQNGGDERRLRRTTECLLPGRPSRGASHPNAKMSVRAVGLLPLELAPAPCTGIVPRIVPSCVRFALPITVGKAVRLSPALGC